MRVPPFTPQMLIHRLNLFHVKQLHTPTLSCARRRPDISASASRYSQAPLSPCGRGAGGEGLRSIAEPPINHPDFPDSQAPLSTAVERGRGRGSPRRAFLALTAVAGLLAITAAACTRAPSPQGWAPPQPVMANNQQLIIAAHKSKLYALPPNVTTAVWQFPPVDKNSLPISQVEAGQLNDTVDSLNIPDDQKSSLKTKVQSLNVQGPSVNDLKNAVKALERQPRRPHEAHRPGRRHHLLRQEGDFQPAGLLRRYRRLDRQQDDLRRLVPRLRLRPRRRDRPHRLDQNTNAEMVGGVAIDDGTVYYGSKGSQVFAADAATGKIKWTFATKGEVWSTPTIADGTIYVTSLDGTVYALDDTGKTRWTFANPNAGIAGSATVNGDAVYVGAFDNKLYSIKTSDGTENWSYQAGNWFWGAARVQDGVVYAANLDGKVYAIDDASGKLKWNKPFDTGSPVRSSPTIAGGGLIVANKAGQVYKLDLSSGQSMGTPYDAGSTIYANLTTQSPATVYVSPQSPQLVVLNASGNLKVDSSYGLAQ